MKKRRSIKAERLDATISRSLTIRQQTASSARQNMRADRWVNERNRFGGSRDPISRTTFFPDVTMTRPFLETLFRYDWLTRRAVEIPAQDATREWIDLKHDNPKRAQDAERELERLGVQGSVEELVTLSRLYGGAVLIMGAFDGDDPTQPLGEVREVFFLRAVDRYLAYPLTFYTNRMDPKYGQPELYQVMNPTTVHGGDVQVVHETRLVRMDGNYLPPLQRIQNFTYGASIIETLLEATRQFGVVTQGMAGTIQDFVTKKLKVADLQDLLQTPDGMEDLQTRLGELAAGMSMHNIAVFGADEEFDKMGTPINGMPDIADRFVEYVSAATGIPRSRLFSNLSGRLGGDAGENDLRVHYDNISAFQRNRLRPKIQRILDVVLQPLGFEPGELTFDFKPLWQPSEKEQSETRLAVAQADQIYISTGVVEPEEVALSRFGGDGINIHDMQIEKKPREKFLKQLRTAAETPSRDTINNPPEPTIDPNAGDPKSQGDGSSASK